MGPFTGARRLPGGLGASYTAVAVVVAFAVLAAHDLGPTEIAALVLLAPLALLLPCAACFRAIEAITRGRERRLGSAIRRALAPLGHPYRLTASPCPGGERDDQVVVGPNGVFVVVAREDRPRLRAAGPWLLPAPRPRWRDLVDDCRIEALRVEERLRRASLGRRPAVHAIVCLRGALVTVGRQIRGVRLVTLAQLPRTILEVPAPAAPLAEPEVEAVIAALERTSPVVPLRADGRAPDAERGRGSAARTLAGGSPHALARPRRTAARRLTVV